MNEKLHTMDRQEIDFTLRKGDGTPLAAIGELSRQGLFVNSRSAVRICVSAPLPKRETARFGLSGDGDRTS